jgi:hypothetical protein
VAKLSDPRSASHRLPAARGATVVLIFLLALAAASCQDSVLPDRVHLPNFSGQPASCVQEGEVTVRDGFEAEVRYKMPYASPPQLTLVEIRQSIFKDRPFDRRDFEFTEQKGASFKIKSNHPEEFCNAWATVKWRAVGVRLTLSTAP